MVHLRDTFGVRLVHFFEVYQCRASSNPMLTIELQDDTEDRLGAIKEEEGHSLSDSVVKTLLKDRKRD